MFFVVNRNRNTVLVFALWVPSQQHPRLWFSSKPTSHCNKELLPRAFILLKWKPARLPINTASHSPAITGGTQIVNKREYVYIYIYFNIYFNQRGEKKIEIVSAKRQNSVSQSHLPGYDGITPSLQILKTFNKFWCNCSDLALRNSS